MKKPVGYSLLPRMIDSKPWFVANPLCVTSRNKIINYITFREATNQG